MTLSDRKHEREFLTSRAFFPQLQPSSEQPGRMESMRHLQGDTLCSSWIQTCLPAMAPAHTPESRTWHPPLDLKAWNLLREQGSADGAAGSPLAWGPSSPCPTVCHNANRHGCVPVSVYKTGQKQVAVYTFHLRSMHL